MKPYGKRDREMAARICSAMACWKDCGLMGALSFAVALGASLRAVDLACRAFDLTPCMGYRDLDQPHRGWWGEAEALIRTGWTP